MGLIPPTSMPPKVVTSKAPTIGAIIPKIPMLAVSQTAIAVARSSSSSEFAQMTPQFCMLTEFPIQYAAIAMIIAVQL